MLRIVIMLFLAAVVSFAPLSASAIDPENMTPEDYTLVERNCKEAQRSMQRIKYVDPIYRVNRGVAYSTISKLMTAMTNRAAFNAFQLPQLSQDTTAVQDLRSQFANDYTDYEIALSDAISYNCRSNPQEFYRKVVDVRTKRSIVALRVREIERRLDAFSAATVELSKLISLQVEQ